MEQRKIALSFKDLTDILEGRKVELVSKDEFKSKVSVELNSWDRPFNKDELLRKVDYYSNDFKFFKD